ncbi:MAG: hypothetical protein ACHQYP_10240 [Nitrospiria bacterium]
MNHCCLVTSYLHEMRSKQIYREITKLDKRVFIDCFSDDKDGVTRLTLESEYPLEILATIIFFEHGNRNTSAVKGLPIIACQEERNTFDAIGESMKQGWDRGFDPLEIH